MKRPVLLRHTRTVDSRLVRMGNETHGKYWKTPHRVNTETNESRRYESVSPRSHVTANALVALALLTFIHMRRYDVSCSRAH